MQEVNCATFSIFIVIVSVVKICKQCLRTVSAFRGLCLQTSWAVAPQMGIPSAAAGSRQCHTQQTQIRSEKYINAKQNRNPTLYRLANSL